MRRLLLTLTLSVLGSTASAGPAVEYLVDTGTPTGNFVRDDEVIPNTGWALNGTSVCPLLNCVQWLAGEFSLATRSMVTGIEGYIRSEELTGGLLRVAIYSDAGDLPGNLLRFADFMVPNGAAYDWYGVDGLHWNLRAGSYWVAFEVPGDSTFGGGMLCCAPRPLGSEAYWGIYQSETLAWHRDDALDMGIRITGRALPEPHTFMLLAAGFVPGLLLSRRRKQKSAAGTVVGSSATRLPA